MMPVNRTKAFKESDKLMESKGFGWSNKDQCWNKESANEYKDGQNYTYCQLGNGMLFKKGEVKRTSWQDPKEKKK
jgi:hypothetical protein